MKLNLNNPTFHSLLLLTCILFLSGCFLAPAIDSFKRAGVTKSDRAALLPKSVKTFYEAMYWGDPQQASILVTEDRRQDIVNILNKARDKEKFVEARVETTTLSEDGYDADLVVNVKYYKIPYYIVTERKEIQKWKFDTVDGWKMAELNFNNG